MLTDQPEGHNRDGALQILLSSPPALECDSYGLRPLHLNESPRLEARTTHIFLGWIGTDPLLAEKDGPLFDPQSRASSCDLTLKRQLLVD